MRPIFCSEIELKKKLNLSLWILFNCGQLTLEGSGITSRRFRAALAPATRAGAFLRLNLPEGCHRAQRREFRPTAWQGRSLAWLKATLPRNPATLAQNPHRFARGGDEGAGRDGKQAQEAFSRTENRGLE